MKTLIRTIHPEVRVIDEAKGIVDYVASDESVDSYREVICAAGWKFDLFRRNAPLVDSHDYSRIENQLGKITDFSVKGGQLINRAQFALDVPEHTLPRIAWGMVSKGYLKACSVGFFPVKAVSRYDQDPKPFNEQIAALKLDDDREKVRTIYLEQQQIELSVCVLGANPSALVKAFRGGAVSEEDLDALGLKSDEEKSFVLDAGEQYEGAPVWAKTLIEGHWAGLIKAFPKKQSKTASPQAPAGADEALRQERTAFLRDLRGHTAIAR